MQSEFTPISAEELEVLSGKLTRIQKASNDAVWAVGALLTQPDSQLSLSSLDRALSILKEQGPVLLHLARTQREMAKQITFESA